jgi:cobalt-zinc-cadmium efflux system membrane fusion protein
VTVIVDGMERQFQGTVDFISPIVDPGTRTVRARAAIDNTAGHLRANMYARVSIATQAATSSILVPRQSVQEAKGAKLVFVRLGEDEFETRRVNVTPVGDDLFAIAENIRVGEDVVTTGSFLLKTETLKESIGAGCCEVEPPK